MLLLPGLVLPLASEPTSELYKYFRSVHRGAGVWKWGARVRPSSISLDLEVFHRPPRRFCMRIQRRHTYPQALAIPLLLSIRSSAPAHYFVTIQILLSIFCSPRTAHYFDVYEKHFSRFRGTDVVVAEVGIYSGGSLKMWRHYFGPRAVIYGIDISNRTRVYERNPSYGSPDRIFVGDQSQPVRPEGSNPHTPSIVRAFFLGLTPPECRPQHLTGRTFELCLCRPSGRRSRRRCHVLTS